MREWLDLYKRALLLGTASLWTAGSVALGISVYALVVWAIGLALSTAIALGLALVLLAGQIGALRIARSAEGELIHWQRRPVSDDHAYDLRENMLRNYLGDIQNERPTRYGDQPGGRPFRKTMILAHFPRSPLLSMSGMRSQLGT